MFTLAHEFARIWLGQDSFSNTNAPRHPILAVMKSLTPVINIPSLQCDPAVEGPIGKGQNVGQTPERVALDGPAKGRPRRSERQKFLFL